MSENNNIQSYDNYSYIGSYVGICKCTKDKNPYKKLFCSKFSIFYENVHKINVENKNPLC